MVASRSEGKLDDRQQKEKENDSGFNPPFLSIKKVLALRKSCFVLETQPSKTRVLPISRQACQDVQNTLGLVCSILVAWEPLSPVWNGVMV